MRFGLIGTGFWAREVHAAALDAAPHVELVGVWGRDRSKAERLAEPIGIEVYDDVSRLFADADAIAFSVPPDVQAPLAIQAAQAGCHLLLEKPTGLSVDQADAVLAAARAGDVASVVFFTSRFLPTAAEWLDRTVATGGWVGAQATWLGSVFHPGNPFGESPWRREQGALWDIGPHALSFTLPLMGSVGGVAAVRGPGDTVHAVLNHTGGGSSTLLVSLTAPEAAAGSSFDVYGEAGWEHLPAVAWEPVQAHQAASQALVRSAESGEPHPCDAAFGREVVDVLHRVQLTLD